MTILKQTVNDPAFQAAHRSHDTAFTRHRHLSFAHVTALILQKSLKSLQLRLNEFFQMLHHLTHHSAETVTASALTQARHTFKHTAFSDLLTRVIVTPYYHVPSYRTWHGFRVLAVDGSSIRLPDTPDIRQEFGTLSFANQYREIQGEHPFGLSVVYYDVLNQIPLVSTLTRCTAYEADVALTLLPSLTSTDLVLCDRGFPSYRFLATLSAAKTHVVARCSRKSFAEAQALFAHDAPVSRLVTLRPTAKLRAVCRDQGVPHELPVRFVRIVFASGEIDVLVTSLLDEAAYPATVFKELYHLRWGVETLFDRLKNRLHVEHFSGKTIEAVKQDFYATVFLCGLESVLIEDAQQRLTQKPSDNTYPQQVNKMVSFHAIKHRVIDLVLSDRDPQTLYEELTELFVTAPVPIRQGRRFKRMMPTATQRVHYYKRIKNICF